MLVERTDSESGYTLIEIMVTMLTFSVIMSLGTSMMLSTMRVSQDNSTVLQSEEVARATLDTMAYDLRLTGAGMALGQQNFLPGAAGLGDAPLPILITASATHVDVRLDEYGKNAVLTSDFDSGSDSTLSVDNAADFAVGDIVYVSNMSLGEPDGLRGTIDSISGNDITLEAGFISSASAVFDSGSLVHRVTEIAYDSPADGSGIVRTGVNGAQVIAPNSSFSIEYLDANLNAIALPLTEASIANELAALRLNVTIDTLVPISKGQWHQAQASHIVMLRNLTINR